MIPLFAVMYLDGGKTTRNDGNSCHMTPNEMLIICNKKYLTAFKHSNHVDRQKHDGEEKAKTISKYFRQ